MVTDIRTRTNDAETESSGSGRAPDPIGALRRWWIWSLLVFVLVAGGGIAWAWNKGKPKYRTEGVLYVSPRFVRNLDLDSENDFQSNSQYREFVQQQVRTINRHDIMLDVVSEPTPAAAAWRKPKETLRRAAQRLGESLQISPVPDTYQVTIGLESEERNGLAEMINSTMEHFVATMRKEMIYDRENRLKNLEAERERVKQATDELIEQRTQIAQLLGTTMFAGGAKNSFESQAGDSNTALMEARRQRIMAEAVIGKGDTTGATDAGLRAAALDQALKESGLSGLRSALSQKKADLVLRMGGLSAQHPGRIALERDIAAIDREIEAATGQAQEKSLEAIQAVQRGKLAQSTLLESKLEAEQQKLQKNAATYSRAYSRSIELGDEIDRQRKRLNATEDRIAFLQLENKAPGFVRVFSTALPPDMPFGGGRKKLFLMVLGAAFVLGLAVAIGLDMLDPRVRSTKEMTAILKLPVTHWTPQCKGLLEDEDSPQVIRLAVTLRRHLDEFKGRCIVITGLRHGAGSSSMALALARALDSLGVRTLVAEANVITPDERYLGVKKRPGLCDLVSGDARFEDCVEPGNSSMPDRIGVGVGATEKAMLAGRSLTEALAQSTHDLILVDAPPLSLSLAAEEMVRQIGATLLVVSAGEDKRGEVKDAMAIIDRLQPRTFGAVLNRAAA